MTVDPYGQAGVEASKDARLADVAHRFVAWLGDGAVLLDAGSPTGGASGDLLVVRTGTADGECRYVLRLEPQDAVYPDVDRGRQFRCCAAAAESGAPVPRPLWFVDDPDVLGRPFLVTEYVEGEPGDFRFESAVDVLAPEEQADVWRRGLTLVASVHATDVSGLEARLDVEADDPIDRYVRYWRRYRTFVDDGRDLPILDAAIDELDRARPSSASAETLVWGDARFGNILFRGLEPVAALDFEFAHVGLAELDVAFYSLFDRISFEYFRPGRRPTGFPTHDETFDLYESLTGRRISDRRWFTVLAGSYSALAVTKVMQARAAAGLVPETMVTGHPSMRALADVLEGR